MDTIALLCQKGGVGKSMTALTLAVAAEQAGKTVVVIDLDPQATACNWSDRREQRQGLTTPVVIDAQPARLANALAKAREQGVDLVLIDTPARSEHASHSAVENADLVLIPCRPQIYDLETIPNSQRLIALAGDKPTVAVLTSVPARGGRADQTRRAIEGMGIPVATAMLGQRAAFGDAAVLGLTVLEYQPHGKAAEESRKLYRYISGVLKKQETGKSSKQEIRKSGNVKLN